MREIRPHWLLVTKGYGFTTHDIDMSCPADLKPYLLAYEQEQAIKDRQAWSWIGSYGISALIFAIDHCFNGRKATTKYVGSANVDREEYEEKEAQKQRDLFVAGLMAMQANFEMNKKQSKNE